MAAAFSPGHRPTWGSALVWDVMSGPVAVSKCHGCPNVCVPCWTSPQPGQMPGLPWLPSGAVLATRLPRTGWVVSGREGEAAQRAGQRSVGQQGPLRGVGRSLGVLCGEGGNKGSV